MNSHTPCFHNSFVYFSFNIMDPPKERIKVEAPNRKDDGILEVRKIVDQY